MNQLEKKRILLVDDNVAIHTDFNKILSKHQHTSLENEEALLFGLNKPTEKVNGPSYTLDSAYQGQEAVTLVEKSLVCGKPYALAFVDMRMPPGWDGIETIKRMWELDPSIQIVICSAYSDHSWEEISHELGHPDNLLILKKPFEVIEIKQLAVSLTTKWELVTNLYGLVKQKTDRVENLQSLTQATLESIQEGILAIGLNEQVLTYNKNFLQQFSVSPEQVDSKKARDIFDTLAENTHEPASFVNVMNALMISVDSALNPLIDGAG